MDTNKQDLLVEKLLTIKGDNDNRIDLNAYALGLIDMYQEVKAKEYTEEDVIKLLCDYMQHMRERVANYSFPLSGKEWFNEHKSHEN